MGLKKAKRFIPAFYLAAVLFLSKRGILSGDLSLILIIVFIPFAIAHDLDRL